MRCRYNAFQRSAELELVPVLRAYGIRYYVYNPLAAGMLVGKYRAESIPEGSRFTDTGRQGAQYKGRYFHDEAFAAIALIEQAGAAASPPLTMLECAIRWTAHHSALDAALGDKIIVGVSSLEQLEQNMAARGGPLPEAVREAVEAAYELVKGREYHYGRGLGVWRTPRNMPKL
jgi:aflatoxin B1 aldehyde reductase